MPASKQNNARLSSPVTILSGIGPKKAALLAKLGVFTLEDIFFLRPRRYEDRRNPPPLCDIEPGMITPAVGKITELEIDDGMMDAVISDKTGSVEIVWFTDKITFLREGMTIAVYGQVSDKYLVPKFTHPEFEILRWRKKPTLIGKILPIYPGTADLTQRALRKFVDTALYEYASVCLKEFLPKSIIKRRKMMSFHDAVIEIHHPKDEDTFIRARNRLAFDELFLLQAGIIMRRNSYSGTIHAQQLTTGGHFRTFMDSLPFSPTDAQRVAICEILEDLERTKPMNRLLQGDVGSGKTLVAAAAMLAACDSGAQSAIMAPTEILAQQHYLKLRDNFSRTGLNVALLTGSLKARERKKILEGIADGTINIVVGTHAVFSEAVNFHSLALVIVDEQHRFGVLQRNSIIAKGTAPHVLTMTATPIPRTLIMSVYGDLEVSVLNELPPGRTPVKTIALTPSEMRRVYTMIRARVKKGEQVFWVCPMIDDSERDLAAVNSTYERLSKILSGVRMSVLHGRLPVDEKSRIMQEFSAGKIDMLIATTVIEVGVDVPNASMMVIEDAGQFGLAQLHQLRGRVGRGKAESVCVLLENASITPEGRGRLAAMVESSDGFELAEMDLTQRGAGEICGTHQHGVTDFRIADIVRDEKILMLARDDARVLLENDPALTKEPDLRREVLRRLGGVLELAATS